MTTVKDIAQSFLNGSIGGCKTCRVIRQSQGSLENYGVGIALYFEYKMDNLCEQY